VNGFVCKQLEASGMHARQHRDRHAGIQEGDDRYRTREREIELAAGEHLRLYAA
jgi:hypothetical protein